MMYPRLKLARNFLREDGVIFMSIDDAEMGNLQQIASQVFGAQNFVGTMVWAAGRKNDSRFISASHEYILCFARSLATLRELRVDWKVRKKGLDEIYRSAERFLAESGGDERVASEKMRTWYRGLPDGHEAKRNKHYSRIDRRGVYFAGDISWPGGGGPKYEVLHPKTNRPVKVPSRGWLFQKSVMNRHIADNRVVFGQDEHSVPTFKRYLRDTESEVPYSVFYQDGRAASKRLRNLMGDKVFDYPKDETVLQTLVEMTTSGDDLVMDFFAGSGTTAHAVMAANAGDGASRRYLMVQLDEAVTQGSDAEKAGYDSIAAIGRERIRRAAAQIDSGSSEAVDRGFRAMCVATTNLSARQSAVDEISQGQLFDMVKTIKPGRTGEDLLFQVLLDWGLEPSLPMMREEVDDREVFSVDEDALIACFADSMTPEVVRVIAERAPLRAVFRDDAFPSDAARINAEQVFREVSPATEVRTI